MKKRFLLLLFWSIAWGQVTVVQAPVPKFRSFTPSGLPNVGGCVYTYASGTSTPQATYTDSTGLFANSNPVILDANGEAQIFITSAVYRFQVWSFGSGVIGSNCGNGTQLYQIDGIRDTGLNALNGPLTIAPTTNGIDILSIVRATDVSASGNFVNFKSFAGASLFKVDINGNLTAVGGTFSGAVSGTTGTFTGAISGTTGTLSGGIITATEVAAPSGLASSDVLWADSTAHRWMMKNNNGAASQVVASGNDITTLDAVTDVHFGNTQIAFSVTPPTTSQFLQFNGTNIVGTSAVFENSLTWGVSGITLTGGSCNPTITAAFCVPTVLTNSHTLIRFTYVVGTAPVTCSPNAVVGVRDITSSTNLTTSTVTAAAGTFVDSGALSVAMTAGHTFAVGLLTAAAGCGTSPVANALTMVYQ